MGVIFIDHLSSDFRSNQYCRRTSIARSAVYSMPDMDELIGYCIDAPCFFPSGSMARVESCRYEGPLDWNGPHMVQCWRPLTPRRDVEAPPRDWTLETIGNYFEELME
jgi:hypothetical protein